MKISRLFSAVFVCVLTLSYELANAGVLYFTEDYNPNGLYTINTVTGVATLSGSGITGNTSSTFGLAPSGNPEYLYSGRYDNGYETTVINADGSGVAVTGTSGFAVEGLAYDALNDVLYGTWNDEFWTINPSTGTILNTLPDVPTSLENLTFAHGGVYAADYVTTVNNEKVISLYFYDPSISLLGEWMLLGNMANPNPGGADYFITGLAYDAENDLIYSVGKGDNVIGAKLRLGIIDPQALEITLIGNTGIDNVSGGLAYASVPIPASVWLFGSGLLGLIGIARRKAA